MATKHHRQRACLICGTAFHIWGRRSVCSQTCRDALRALYYQRQHREAISHEALLALLEYNAGSGHFTNLIDRPPRAKAGSLTGRLDALGYTTISIRGRRYYAHRLAWFYVHGSWPNGEIDHINGVKTDNRIANLRDVSKAMNRQNIRKAQRDNELGMLGVSLRQDRYAAQLHAGGRRMLIGLFDTAEEAHAAYLAAKRRLHEGCTI